MITMIMIYSRYIVYTLTAVLKDLLELGLVIIMIIIIILMIMIMIMIAMIMISYLDGNDGDGVARRNLSGESELVRGLKCFKTSFR